MSKSKKPPVARCPKCAGSGTVTLPPQLAATLAAIGKQGATARELHAAHGGWGVSCWNNRLETLKRRGMVRRERDSRWFRYFRV